MVLKLYTGNGRGVVDLVLAEKHVPHERVVLDIAHRQYKTPEYLAMHPFGQIPVIDDDGFILGETRRYIAEKYAEHGPALVPIEVKAKARFEAASFEFANFHPHVLKALRLY